MAKRKIKSVVQDQENVKKTQKRGDEAQEQATISRKLVLKDMPEAIKELNKLANNQSYASQELWQSEFYKKLMQGVTELDASKVSLSQNAKILLVWLATCLKLHTLNFSGNNLGESGVEVAILLSKSTTLRGIDLSNNGFNQASSEVTKNLLRLATLATLSMKGNNLNFEGMGFDDEENCQPEYSIDTAEEAKIRKIIYDHNHEVSLCTQLANMPNALNDLKLPLELIEIIGGYYYYYNYIDLEV